jgi:hypothetical protein
MAPAVEQLLSKQETLSSKPSTVVTKTKTKTKNPREYKAKQA